MREKRLYYDQSYLQEFQSRPVFTEKRGDLWYVELEQTAFYPTSGGQPHDTGSLNSIAVIDVVEEDERILHVLASDPGEGMMTGRIDWQRRFDFMQQHSGQHILSQAFLQRLEAMTIGFHLTETTLTIDLDVQKISDEDIVWVEDEANRVIWSDKRIISQWCDDEKLAGLPLRKPPKVDKDIRVVEVEGYDWSPCGGTHVRCTSEIGLIKIRRWERSKGVTRVEFLCGWRALADYRFKNRFSLQMAADLSVKDRDLPEAWQRQRELLKEADQHIRHLGAELLAHQAEGLLEQAERWGEIAVICRKLPELDFADLKQLSLHLAHRDQTVALLALADGSPQFAFSRSAELNEVQLNQLLKRLFAEIPGKGGGTPQTVQGMVADAAQLDAFLRRAGELLRDS